MPEPRMRSTSAKKRVRRSPKGKKIIMLKPKKPAHAHCALCGAILGGMPRMGVHGTAKIAKTGKRPQRVFGGVLCGKCTQAIIKEKTRLELGAAGKKDMDIRHWKYLDMLKIK
ncbi:MAG: 50S ribosomal protein L34e [Candidatus Micrarchaeota archaeon]|nr:50S ribosomal protein L34e [Candidatus Micrarchaeota archaeon]